MMKKMDVLGAVVLMMVVAVTVEGLVEYGKSVYKLLAESGKKALALQLAALAVAVFLCLTAGADLYAWLGVEFVVPHVGCVLTGVFASRGANYASDFIGRVRGAKEAA